jgi:hypothetical protein
VRVQDSSNAKNHGVYKPRSASIAGKQLIDHEQRVVYLTIVNSIRNTIFLSLLLSCFAGVSQAGQQKDSRVVAIGNRVNLVAASQDRAPQPEPQTYFTPGKQFQLNPRIDFSAKAILITDHIPPQVNSLHLPIDVPFNHFTQGVYLRYRPRDPTLA